MSGRGNKSANEGRESSASDGLTRGYYHGPEKEITDGMVMEYIEVCQTINIVTTEPPKSSSKRRSRKSRGGDDTDTTTTGASSNSNSTSVASSEQPVETALAGYSWEDELTNVREAQVSGTTETATETDSSKDLEAGNKPSAFVKINHIKKPAPMNRRDSDLPPHEDPFASRPGRTLKWSNVNMTLASTRKQPERKILDGVWGEVPRQEVTAIMGPSGAGKTSLLNILSGRVSARGRLKIDADVRLDNYSVNPRNMKVRRLIAFVAQDDSLQVTATPREAISFSAKLRLPRSTTDHDIKKLTNRMLNELGLNDCADTIIGGALVKGLSGGERKRTSVGVELCCKPDLLFLDEPTSGLDSFSAEQLCQVLKKVANAGASVLFTIHQPASEIFSSFDHLILLNQGRVMYQGSVSNVPRYFAKRGHPCPSHHNPADWVMNRAQAVPISELEKAGFFPDDNLIMEEKVPLDSAAKKILFERDASAVLDPRPPSTLLQIHILLRREFTNLKRDKVIMAGRLGVCTVLSFLVGAIYLGVGKSDPAVIGNLQSHFGALVLCCLLCMVGCAQPALLAFPAERPVFVREYSTNHYTVIAYFVSRFVIEAIVTAIQVLVICAITYSMISFKMSFFTYAITNYALAMSATALSVAFGCAIEDPTLGQELFPLLFVPQMLFSGFFITPSLIPYWLQWGRYVCALTFGLMIIMLEEFSDCGDGWAQTNCNLLIDMVEANENHVVWYWIILVALFFAFRLLALALLRKKASKFF